MQDLTNPRDQDKYFDFLDFCIYFPPTKDIDFLKENIASYSLLYNDQAHYRYSKEFKTYDEYIDLHLLVSKELEKNYIFLVYRDKDTISSTFFHGFKDKLDLLKLFPEHHVKTTNSYNLFQAAEKHMDVWKLEKELNINQSHQPKNKI